MDEVLVWKKKIDEWIIELLEIDKTINEVKEMEISKDKKLEIWEMFKKVIDEYGENYWVLWKLNMYQEMDKVSNLIDVVFNELMEFVKV